MANKKKYNKPTIVISHRITYENLEKLDKIANMKRTRTDLINEGIELLLKKIK